MKSFETVCVLIAVVNIARASTVQQANKYIDKLLVDLLQADSKAPFSEEILVPDFNITVKSNFISNRELQAYFSNGRVLGLSKIYRDGDCQPTRWVSGNVTVSNNVPGIKIILTGSPSKFSPPFKSILSILSEVGELDSYFDSMTSQLECRLNLSPMAVAYAAVMRGHSFLGSEEKLDFFVRVRKATAQLEARSKPNMPAVIRSFIVEEPLTVDVRQPLLIETPLVLWKAERRAFYGQLKIRAKQHVQNALATKFVKILNRLLASYERNFLLPVVKWH